MVETRGYTYFAWLKPSRAGHGFLATFTDINGDHHYLSRGSNSRGEILFKRFKFSPSKRMLIIPNSQQDVIQFLRKYPGCEASEYGEYVWDEGQKKNIQIGVFFKEVNEGKDAQVGVDAVKDRIEAQKIALGLEDPKKAAELKQMAVRCGFYSDDAGLQLWHIIQYAEHSPQRFLELYEDPTKEAKYIVDQGLHGSNPILVKKGFMIYWQEVHLGNNFNDAVQAVLNDDQLKEAIVDDLARAGTK